MQWGFRSGLLSVIVVMAPLAAQADMVQELSGKTLVAGKSRIVMGADGAMSGKVGADTLTGTWMVRDGKLCRTISAPKRMAGSECQTAVLRGNTLQITRADGSTLEWSVE